MSANQRQASRKFREYWTLASGRETGEDQQFWNSLLGEVLGVELSCIGEGNGNPLQCFCLENPRDGGAWWATIYGVAPSRTRLKQLRSR